MKTTIYLLTLLLAFNVSSQITSKELDHNNVAANISDAGTFFIDLANSTPGYEVPKGSGSYPIYSTQFWFAGKDGLNNIHFVQGGFPGQGNDLYSGPISDVGTYTSAEYQSDWGTSIWKICQSEIDNFILWWDCNNGVITTGCEMVTEPSPQTLQTLYDWPAHGRTSQGQAYNLAPFFDRNVDGVYSPDDGDYPEIKGCCAVYMIQNDAAQSHTYSDTDSMGIEIHSMFYQYQTANYLNDVTFVDLTVINRGNTNYSELMHGVYVDADLGNYSDDYYGCDPATNVMYFYNADNNDEQSASPYTSYGFDPPVIGIVSLDKNMTSCVTPITSSPTVAEKWNLMNGLKENGSPWIDPSSNPTQFVFSGNPNNGAEWSAYSTAAPTGDARGLSSNNFGTFNSGDTVKQSYAIVYARNGDHLDNVQNIIDISADIKVFFDQESDEACNGATWSVNEIGVVNIQVYPNPSFGIFNVSNPEGESLDITLLDSKGIILRRLNSMTERTIEINMEGQSSGVYFLQLNSETGSTVQKLILE